MRKRPRASHQKRPPDTDNFGYTDAEFVTIVSSLEAVCGPLSKRDCKDLRRLLDQAFLRMITAVQDKLKCSFRERYEDLCAIELHATSLHQVLTRIKEDHISEGKFYCKLFGVDARSPNASADTLFALNGLLSKLKQLSDAAGAPEIEEMQYISDEPIRSWHIVLQWLVENTVLLWAGITNKRPSLWVDKRTGAYRGDVWCFLKAVFAPYGHVFPKFSDGSLFARSERVIRASKKPTTGVTGQQGVSRGH